MRPGSTIPGPGPSRPGPSRPGPSRPAAVAALVAVVLVLGTAFACPAADRPAAQASGPSLLQADRPAAQLVPSLSSPILVEAQSPWVMSGQTFHLRLKVTAADAATDKIQVEAFSRLTTRSSFENALAGRPGGTVKYPPVVVPLSQLPPDPSGGYDIDIPVNRSGSATPRGPGSFPSLSAVGDSGIFPLQVGVYSGAGVLEGRPVTTFLVYAAAPGSASGLPKLNVALIVPVAAPPTVGSRGEIGAVTPSESARIQQLVTALQGHQDVPVSLAASPQTLDVLQAGSPTDRSVVASLQGLRASADEVLPATYARVSMGDLLGSGLPGELSAQFGVGASTLAKVFGPGSTGSTWVFDGALDQASAGAVLARGVSRLIVPDGDLSALPLAARQTTFALPTRLTGVTRGIGPEVYAADAVLTNDFNGSGGPVLAADHMLAELAMIQLETPGIDRGVAVVPPHRWNADPVFVGTLLAGLSGHPLLQGVTATGLFSAVKVSDVQRSLVGAADRGGLGSGGASGPGVSSASGFGAGAGAETGPAGASQSSGSSHPAGSPQASQSSGNSLTGGSQRASGSGQAQGSGQLASGGSLIGPPAGSLAGDAGAIRDARKRVQAFQAVLTSEQQVAEQLQDALLVAESTDVTQSQRRTIIDAVRAGSAGALRAVTLPGSSSITLTATRGQIPLTILSPGGARAKVELRLSSQRLIFRPFHPPSGSCQVPTPTSEVCQLTVSGQNTTLKVPVEARSSGVFPLDVSLWTPGGGIRLAKEQNTVRSTAVSGAGVILIIVAVLSLALWWVRDLRHGRRARRLVPPPGADEPELRLDDPVVREFFENPPPGYRGKEHLP